MENHDDDETKMLIYLQSSMSMTSNSFVNLTFNSNTYKT